jgi:hypothetical protein
MQVLRVDADGWTWWIVADADGACCAGPFDEEAEALMACGCHHHGSLMATFPEGAFGR